MAGPTPTFIEVGAFTARWSSLGLGDVQLAELQELLAADPSAGDVVRGGNGLRKLWFAPANWAGGKSGGLRVYYADFPGFGVIVLVTVFAKSAAGDISRDMVRELAAAVGAIRAALEPEGG